MAIDKDKDKDENGIENDRTKAEIQRREIRVDDEFDVESKCESTNTDDAAIT